MNTKKIDHKTDKREQAQAEFAKLMENVSVRGFYGTAGVTITSQDGYIQNIRLMVERTIR